MTKELQHDGRSPAQADSVRPVPRAVVPVVGTVPLRPTGVSFDDGLVGQLKWGRTMHRLGLQGTFYINPGYLGRGSLRRGQLCMSEHHVRQLADWGHVIGNHTWAHEAPRTHTHVLVLDSIYRTADWLNDRGWEGYNFAMPFGSEGGLWDENFTRYLVAKGYTVRDFVGAQESTGLPLTGLRTFHGNHNTTDDAMAKFLWNLADQLAAPQSPAG